MDAFKRCSWTWTHTRRSADSEVTTSSKLKPRILGVLVFARRRLGKRRVVGVKGRRRGKRQGHDFNGDRVGGRGGQLRKAALCLDERQP